MKKKEDCPGRDNMRQITAKDTEAIIRRIAMKEGSSVERVRQHIQIAMIAGMMSPDPKARAAWEQIPHTGEVPTPEEAIAYYANMTQRRRQK